MNPDNDASQLKFFSLGIVANNNPISSNTIVATPIESLMLLDGEIASEPIDEEIEGVDAKGENYTSKVKADNAIEADWLPFSGSNRRTAPNVRRGERVIIWQYADDNDTYYWSTLGMDDHLRKLETVVYSFSGTRDEASDSFSPENCYSLEVSTHEGRITLTTSKANEEFCIYAIQINPKDGRILICDELNNEIELNSKETIISFTNADGTTVQLDKKKIYAYAPDQIHLKADNAIIMQTKDYKIETTNYTLKSSANLIDSSNTTVKGAVKFEGDVEFSKRIKANGIISSAPIQGPSDTI